MNLILLLIIKTLITFSAKRKPVSVLIKRPRNHSSYYAKVIILLGFIFQFVRYDFLFQKYSPKGKPKKNLIEENQRPKNIENCPFAQMTLSQAIKLEHKKQNKDQQKCLKDFALPFVPEGTQVK